MRCRHSGRLIRATLALGLATALLACGESQAPAEAVAVWDGGRLDRATYRDWIELQGVEPSAETVRNLAIIRSLAQAARQRGVADSPQVELAVEAARHRILLPALDQHLDSRVEISDEEIESLLRENPDAFERPRKLFLRGIYKRLPEDKQARDALQARMETLRAQVVDGADLASLAAAESESQNRFRDGSLGYVDPQSLPSAVRESVESLAAGDISPVIEYRGGLAFYACEKIKPASRPGADEVRHRLRQNLFRQRRAELGRQLAEQFSEQLEVSVDADPILMVSDYDLPADWLDALIEQRLPERDPDSLDTNERQRLLRSWGGRVAMADHAESLGLAETEPQASALRWRHDEALATAELRHRVDQRLEEPDDTELRNLFEQRRHRPHHPGAYRLSAIQFADSADELNAATLERARRAVDDIDEGRLDFAAAAREFSLHASADRGGELGWLTRQQLGAIDVRLLRPVRQLSPGEHTGLMRLQSGLWLVKLLAQRAPRPMSFEQARDQLAKTARQQQIERLEVQVREQHQADIELELRPH